MDKNRLNKILFSKSEVQVYLNYFKESNDTVLILVLLLSLKKKESG